MLTYVGTLSTESFTPEKAIFRFAGLNFFRSNEFGCALIAGAIWHVLCSQSKRLACKGKKQMHFSSEVGYGGSRWKSYGGIQSHPRAATQK